MGKTIGKTIARILLWTIGILVGLVIIIPVLLYVPPVQSFVKNIALKEVRKSTGMDISVDYLRLRWPLKLQLDGVTIVEATGDTMVTAGQLGVNVKLLPLLKGSVDVTDAELHDALYRMGTPDSAMYLVARIENVALDGATIGLSDMNIDVDRATLDGGDVTLIMKDTTTTTPADTTQSAAMLIKARDIAMNRVRFRMSMLPVIDSLDAVVPAARLSDATVDMARRFIHATALSIDSVSATYLTPSAEYLAEHPYTAAADTTVTPESEMWTVTADSLRLTGRTATYAMRGATPLPGLDMNYLEASDIIIAVDSFYNRGTSITVPLRRLAATERCGVRVNGTGLFRMDSTIMEAKTFDINTLFSTIRFDAAMGVGDLTTDPTLPLRLDGNARISLADIELLMPSLTPMLRDVPRRSDMTLDADIHGTSGLLDIETLKLTLPGYINLSATGSIADAMDFTKMNGKVKLDGSLSNINFIKPTVFEARMARQVNFPPMRLHGNVDYRPNLIAGSLSATTGSGRMALSAKWNGRAQGYDLTVSTDSFPVKSFMPSLGIGTVTARLEANGHGYDPFSPKTAADIKANLGHIDYMGKDYINISLDATLNEGHAQGVLLSHNPGADLDIDFTADLEKDKYTWQMQGDVRELNLQSLDFTPDVNHGSVDFESHGSYIPSTRDIDAYLTINDLDWDLTGSPIAATDIRTTFAASDSTMQLTLANGDLHGRFDAYCPLDTFLTNISALGDTITSQIDRRNADIRAIQKLLPPFDFSLDAGRRNFVADYLAASKTSFRSLNMTAHNDTLLSLNSRMLQFRSGDTRIDTIDVSASQHGKYLVYKASINNRPGTMDAFAHVNLNGFIGDDKAHVLLRQRNIQGKQGFFLGLSAGVNDSVISLRFVPYSPTIGYKKWEINRDNFLSYNYITRHLDANLNFSTDSSYIKLFTEHVPDGDGHQEDVKLQISRLRLSEWLSISPFAPPIKGFVSSNMSFRWDEKQITGTGMLDVDNLYYGRDRVGSFTLDLKLTNNKNGALHADASLMVDSIKVITAYGALNDSTLTNPFLLDFSMIHFPLRVVNPFLPKDMAQLRGMLNGKMDITGSLAHPIFNGYLDFDSTAVKVGMLGTSFVFSEEKIPMDSNVVRFNDFTITACNENPLRVNGTVDVSELTDVAIDLTLNARDMQIVNSTRPRGADVYGKAFIDAEAAVKGDMRFLNVTANLNVLPGTNVTYIMTDASSALTSQSTGDMVQFVQFSDSAAVAMADTIATNTMAMNLEANLRVSSGSTINVDLSTDGKNKVSLQGEGSLTYSMNPMNDGRLTGRYTINSGFVRYTPPLMSEKLFQFQEGSYVAFNGDMLNPILNIHAVDEVKANVTQEGQNSRLVNFDVGLSITNTLENMNVAFNLSTDDDITIQNELSSMSPDQRANQAMNLLLYNVYTGPGTKANANLSGNPLFSFLESQLNSWAANNIKGVDISFGIDQYDRTYEGNTSSTTSYSYRVSKTLFNDRFKIIVGGNYSTDADADENFSQNLINDISFEYMLNRSGSMYVRIFRHTGYESILEGEVTQTGVGFVLKRKIHSLRDLFKWAVRRRYTAQPEATVPNNEQHSDDDENQ